MAYRGTDWETLPDDIRDSLNQVVETIAFIIQRNAQDKIREYDLIDTGDLLNSITVIFYEENGMLVGVVFVGVDYGIYHEMGTIHLPAKPFLYPSVVNAQIDFHEAVRQVLQRIGS